MGLVQNAIERAGIPTISVTVRPEITVNMPVPRAVYVRFPTGNPMGQPRMPNQQRHILRGTLQALVAIKQPGTVLEMPYRWRRMPDVDVGSPTPGVREIEVANDLYADARDMVGRIEERYSELLSEVDRYREWLKRNVRSEQEKPQPDALKLQALNPQVRYLEELQEALEGAAHDGLVRVSDRVVRIKHWQDGEFL